MTTTLTDKVISQFIGEYRFLSNFFNINNNIIHVNKFNINFKFTNVECAYQAHKSTDISWWELCETLTASESKRYSKFIPDKLQDLNFHTNKLNIMKSLIYKKFENDQLKRMLIDTYPYVLIEGNNWNDTFWGVSLSTGIGQNHLGKILMDIRDTFINGQNVRKV